MEIFSENAERVVGHQINKNKRVFVSVEGSLTFDLKEAARFSRKDGVEKVQGLNRDQKSKYFPFWIMVLA